MYLRDGYGTIEVQRWIKHIIFLLQSASRVRAVRKKMRELNVDLSSDRHSIGLAFKRLDCNSHSSIVDAILYIVFPFKSIIENIAWLPKRAVAHELAQRMIIEKKCNV